MTRQWRDSQSGRGYTAGMKRLVALLSLALALAACGNKGPLVMPEARPAAPPEATTPAEQPAVAEPAKTESGTPAR